MQSLKQDKPFFFAFLTFQKQGGEEDQRPCKIVLSTISAKELAVLEQRVGRNFGSRIVSNNCDSVSSPSWCIAFSCMMCTRNILSRQEWQVGLKSGSGSKGTKKNFMTRARIAHSVEIWSRPTFPKSPNLIYVSFLVSGNFIYS